MKSAVWTARNQAESLSLRRDDYRIQFGKKPQETAKFIIWNPVGAWGQEERVESI